MKKSQIGLVLLAIASIFTTFSWVAVIWMYTVESLFGDKYLFDIFSGDATKALAGFSIFPAFIGIVGYSTSKQEKSFGKSASAYLMTGYIIVSSILITLIINSYKCPAGSIC